MGPVAFAGGRPSQGSPGGPLADTNIINVDERGDGSWLTYSLWTSGPVALS